MDKWQDFFRSAHPASFRGTSPSRRRWPYASPTPAPRSTRKTGARPGAGPATSPRVTSSSTKHLRGTVGDNTSGSGTNAELTAGRGVSNGERTLRAGDRSPTVVLEREGGAVREGAEPRRHVEQVRLRRRQLILRRGARHLSIPVFFCFGFGRCRTVSRYRHGVRVYRRVSVTDDERGAAEKWRGGAWPLVSTCPRVTELAPAAGHNLWALACHVSSAANKPFQFLRCQPPPPPPQPRPQLRHG